MNGRNIRNMGAQTGRYLSWIGALLVLVLVLLPALFPPERRPSPVGSAPRAGGELRIDLPIPLGEFDLHSKSGNGASFALQMMVNMLCRLGPDGSPQPELAKSWTMTQQGRKWEFILHSHVRFHDGTFMTPRDVIYSLETQFRNVIPQFLRIARFREDSHPDRVLVELDHPVPNFLSYLAYVPIFPSGSFSNPRWFSHPVGTGPFRFQSRDGRRVIVLSSFQDYFEGRPWLDRLVLRHPGGEAELPWRLLEEKTDLVLEMNPCYDSLLKTADHLLHVESGPQHVHFVILFNTSKPPLNDARIRNALAMGIQTNGLSPNLLPDKQNPMFVPLSNQRFQRAVELLSEAGWRDHDGDGYLDRNGQRFEFSILVPEEYAPEYDTVLRVMAQWKRLGIRADWHGGSYANHYETRLNPGDFQATLFYFRLMPDEPEFLYNLWHHSGIWNFSRYHDEEADRIIEAAMTESDPHRRRDLYAGLKKVLDRDHPFIYLGSKQVSCSLSNYFQGMEEIYGQGRFSRRFHKVRLLDGARPGSHQLTAYARSQPRAFWQTWFHPLDRVVRTLFPIEDDQK